MIFPILYRGDKRLLLYLFNDVPFKNQPSTFKIVFDLVNLTFDDDIVTMITWVLVKAPLLILSIIPTAGGPIGFTECIGAMLGRSMGEIIEHYDKRISVGKLTIAGAASMGVAITQHFTWVIWAIEIGGNIKNVYSIMLTVMVAFYISSKYNGSFLNA